MLTTFLADDTLCLLQTHRTLDYPKPLMCCLTFFIFIFDRQFLANVSSRSRSLYAIARPSVVCLSVTLVRPTQTVQIFGNISTALGTLAIH